MARTKKTAARSAEPVGPVVLDGGSGGRTIDQETAPPVGPVVLDGPASEDQERAEQAQPDLS